MLFVSLITFLMTSITTAASGALDSLWSKTTNNKPSRARATRPHRVGFPIKTSGWNSCPSFNQAKGLNIGHLTHKRGLDWILSSTCSTNTSIRLLQDLEEHIAEFHGVQDPRWNLRPSWKGESYRFRSSRPKSSLCGLHLWIFQFLRRWSVQAGGVREEVGR